MGLLYGKPQDTYKKANILYYILQTKYKFVVVLAVVKLVVIEVYSLIQDVSLCIVLHMFISGFYKYCTLITSVKEHQNTMCIETLNYLSIIYCSPTIKD